MRLPMVLLFLVFNLASLFSLKPGDEYSPSTDWQGEDGKGNIVISGQVNTVVTIKAVSSDSIQIHIFKEMTPFGQFLDFEATALVKDGQYVFNVKDNWENSAFGFVQDKGESLEFLLDCNDYSEDGKNLGRLYGDEEELARKPG